MLIPALILPVSGWRHRPPPGEPPRSLRLSISAFGGYDTDVTRYGAEPGGGAQRAVCRSQGFARLSRSGPEKIGFSARGGADSRHYRADEPFAAASYDGSAVFAAEVTSRLNVSASVNSAYSPRFVFSLLPIAGDIAPDIAPPPLDYAVSAQRMASYATGSNATLRVSRRSTLNVAV